MSQRMRIRFGVGMSVVLLALGAVLFLGLAASSNQPKAMSIAAGSESGHPLAVLEPLEPADLRSLDEETRFRMSAAVSRFSTSAENPKPEVDSFAEVTAPDGTSVSIFGIEQSICFFVQRGPGTCGNDEDMRSEGITVLTPEGCSGWKIVGLIPDGVTRVVTTEGAESSRWPVASGVYVASVGRENVNIRGFDSSDKRLVDIPVDLSWMNEGMVECGK